MSSPGALQVAHVSVDGGGDSAAPLRHGELVFQGLPLEGVPMGSGWRPLRQQLQGHAAMTGFPCTLMRP